jgi:hypothetical protein
MIIVTALLLLLLLLLLQVPGSCLVTVPGRSFKN